MLSNYEAEGHSSAGLETERVHLEVENYFWPFGLTKNYKYEYSGGYDGDNLPTVVRSHFILSLFIPMYTGTGSCRRGEWF